MKKRECRAARAALALLLAAIAACALPAAAKADGEPVTDAENTGYASLAMAISEGKSPLYVVGATDGCDIPSGVEVNIIDGSIAGNVFNSGAINGATAQNCGTIYDYTGAASGGNVRVPGPAVSGVSEVRFAGGGSEPADYQRGTLWIPAGETVRNLIIDGYVCTPSGGRIQYAIAYLYNNAAQSPMTLDAKKYPATYCVMTVDQTIPAAPDTEAGYVFAGWYCQTLGVDETNLQKTITIPADKGANLTLVSWWTASPGHNEGKSGGTSGMAGGMRGGSAGSSGLAGGISAMADALTGDESDDAKDGVESAALTDYSASQGGGMRIRNASATTRHTFSDTDGGVETRAAQRARKRIAWQWIGVGMGGALLVTAAGVTVRRWLLKRNAETLAKLNIRE